MPTLCLLAVVKLFALHAAQVQGCLSDTAGGSKACGAVVNLNDASNLVSNLGPPGGYLW